MNPDDRLSAIADRIADGSAVDWPADSTGTDPRERAILEQLKTIAGLATLHRRPLEWAPDLSAPEGTPWGPLTITSKIGEGRFGQVYLAWDARLQRRVALKILRAESPAASASPAHAIEEARLLARVRHPNVLAVHGAECIDGQIGIWTEFIEGRTLEDLVKQHGPMAPDDVVAIGLDLCRALAAVHAAGLLHRDIKAQNVMRETGGRIVLMDFGTGHDIESRPAKAGDLSGTPLYLAPEVLAGGEATQASDVYALAVLLFRLLTGEYPVPGRTLADVQAGHQQGSAARLSSARPELPAPLVAAIDRGLAADPSRRHRGGAAFEDALQACVAAQSASISEFGRGRVRFWRPALILLAASVMAGAGLAWTVLHHDGRSSDSGGLALGWTTPPLTLGANAFVADVSGDGKRIAYFRNDAQLLVTHYGEIWIHDTETGKDWPVFTADAARPELRAATLTPDGTSIDVLVRATGKIWELWRVPLSGGSERRIALRVVSPPGWAPDGKHMAVLVNSDAGRNLIVLDADGGNPRSLATRHDLQDFVVQGYRIAPATNRPAWSPDGRTIAVAGLTFTADGGVSAEIVLVDAETGVSHILEQFPQRTGNAPAVLQVAWLDLARLLLDYQIEGMGPYQLSILGVSSKALSRVTHDHLSYRGISMTSDRRTIVSTSTENRSEIWVGQVPGVGVMPGSIPESSKHPHDASFDARGDLVYSSDMPDGSAVWVRRSDASTPAFVAWGSVPRVVPNSDEVVFVDEIRRGLYYVSLSGAAVAKILDGAIGSYDVTPDRTVVFIGNMSGSQSIWAVPMAGGVPREVIHQAQPANQPRVSHDGRHLLYRANRTDVVVCDWPSCTRVRDVRVREETGPLGWTPDDLSVAFTSRETGTANIWAQPIDGGPPRQVTRFDDGRTIYEFNWSPDGQKLAVTRGAGVSDVVMLRRSK